MSYLYIGSVSLIIFIISLITGKKEKALSDYILLTWLSVFLIDMITLIFLSVDGYSPKSAAERVLYEFSEASIFTQGPFFWFYTLSLTRPKFIFKKKYLLHFVLSFLVLGFILASDLSNGDVNFYARKWLILAKMVSVLVYTIAVIRQLKMHRIAIRDVFSNIEERKLNWLYFIAWSIIVIWGISCTSLALGLMTYISTPQYVNLFPNISICLFIYLMGYFGVQQNTIFAKYNFRDDLIANASEVFKVKPNTDVKDEKYKKSGLTKLRSDRIYEELITHMDEQRPYLDPDLSLFNLAASLHVQPNHLSQAINEREALNFYDFVNGYRVKAVKEMIIDGKLHELTLLGIALDCGFNSKASFNRAFKKHTSITPSEFKAQKSN